MLYGAVYRPRPILGETTDAEMRFVFELQPGDPAKAARAILTAMASTNPPLRLVLDGDAVDRIRQRLGDLQDELAEWAELGRATSIDE